MKKLSLIKNNDRERKLERLKTHPKLPAFAHQSIYTRHCRLYEKEYGKEKTAVHHIMKESFKILIFATTLSALGGLTLESVKSNFLTIVPLIILLPVLNDMIGNFGTIISARFTTMLFEGYVRKKWWHNVNLRILVSQLFLITLIVAVFSFFISIGISTISGSPYFFADAVKIFLTVLIDMMLLVTILISVAITAGIYLYDKKEDPDNFLIPITTSIADFGNMIILALLVVLLF